MPITVQRNNLQSIAQESSEQSTLQLGTPVYASKQNVAYNAGNQQTVTVAGNASNQQVTFPTGVTNAKYVRVDSSVPITLAFDSSGNYKIQLVQNGADSNCHYEADQAFTALYLNGVVGSGGATATVLVSIAGN